MIEVKGINDLMTKIDRLHESLKLSDEILPLVSDMFRFLADIIPLMLEISAFMREGTKKVPSATDNLRKVNQTTEMATNQVLDKLEHIIDRMEGLKEQVQEGGNGQVTLQMIDELQEEANQIFYAFQFQDITSQQLEYVRKILKAIYTKFVDLFNSSLSIRANTLFGKDVIEAIERELEKGRLEDERVGFHAETDDIVRQDGISQEVIDKYFK